MRFGAQATLVPGLGLIAAGLVLFTRAPVGGDYATPETAPDAAATTRDGGRTWTVAKAAPGEYRSGAAWLSGATALAVGPTGSDISREGGRTWTEFDAGSFDAVLCAAGSCWASGEQGRVAKLTWRR